MDASATVTAARVVAGVAPAMARLEDADAGWAGADGAVRRGYFAPDEETRLRAWFSRYLTNRAALIEAINDLGPPEPIGPAGEGADLRRFAVSFAAACVLVRAARFLIGKVATGKIVQRKLNEAAPSHRIPRKQYTTIYRSLTSPQNAWQLAQAMQLAVARRAELEALAEEPVFAPVVEHLVACAPALDVSVHEYARARLRYRFHAWRRRRATAVQRACFNVMEVFGRVIADVHNPLHRPRLTAACRRELETLLRPGDVIIARHDDAMSNLFLPGYWPHAALHVGPPRATAELALDADRASRWREPLRVLEARKDGVRLRALEDTLAVDAVAVIRPRLPEADIDRAIANAMVHEGKPYNFDFDFFTDDRLVCTEVVYRAYQGVGRIDFPLSHRGGRPTLSAEDLVALATVGTVFEPIAVFGTPAVGNRVATGSSATIALAQSVEEEGTEARRHEGTK